MALGLSLSLFLALSFTLCVLAGLVLPDWSLHQPWLQFFPGFTWLTWQSFLLGLIESFAYGWYVALIFGPLYNSSPPAAGEALAENDGDAPQALLASVPASCEAKAPRLADRVIWLCVPIGIVALVVLLLFGLSLWSALAIAF